MNQQRGFTLVEIIVVVAIFGFLAAAAYGVLGKMFRDSEIIDTRNSELRELQKAMSLLERDFTGMEPRQVREVHLGDFEAALLAGSLSDYMLVFTRGGMPNPAGFARPSIQRIAYELEGNKLVRLAWNLPDAGPDSPRARLELFSGVSEFRISFLDKQGNWLEQWPDPRILEPDPVDLPRAVEIEFNLENHGRIRRLFELLVATR